jgi:hypothetical protein
MLMNNFLFQILAALLLIPTPSASAIAVGQSYPCKQRGFIATPFVRTELFFGARKQDGSEISEAEWDVFLENMITPEFPNGLTVLTGTGRFRGREGVAVEEKGKLLILLYPLRTRKDSSKKIEMIRAAYKRGFQQQSVLRVDDPAPACISF